MRSGILALQEVFDIELIVPFQMQDFCVIKLQRINESLAYL